MARAALAFTGSSSSSGGGGFDIDLFENVVEDSLLCPVCQMVLREPRLVVQCGHHYCKECIEQIQRVNNQCALDRRELSTSPGGIVPDLSIQRRTFDLPVHCEAREYGCQWKGTLGNYQEHAKGSNCTVNCPNKCSKQLSRTKLAAHLEKDCPKAVICCPFRQAGAGCPFQGERQQMNGHLKENMLPHQLLMMTTIDQLIANVWEAASTPSVDRQTVFITTFNDFAKLRRQQQARSSEPFYTGPCSSGYHLELMIEFPRGGKGVSVFYKVVRGKNDDQLVWPFRRKVVLQVLHSCEDRVIIEHATSPPRKEEDITAISGKPTTHRNRKGWGRKELLMFDNLGEAGITSSNILRLKAIVPWVAD